MPEINVRNILFGQKQKGNSSVIIDELLEFPVIFVQ